MSGVSLMHRAVPVVAVSCWLNSRGSGSVDTRVHRALHWAPRAEHTASDGMQFSRLVRVANNGVVFGESSRFLGTGTSKGTSLWAFDGSTTQEIGLFGPEFTGADGYEYSDFTSHYPSGIAFGTTKVIQGTDIFRGQGAWVWNGSATHRLGFFTGGYAGQYPHTRVVESNANGYAIGVSDLTMSGPQGWLWNGVECTRVGLFDANHTGPGTAVPTCRDSCVAMASLRAGLSDSPPAPQMA